MYALKQNLIPTKAPLDHDGALATPIHFDKKMIGIYINI
jgi:hypothetical protein